MENVGILAFTARGMKLAQTTAEKLKMQGVYTEIFDKETGNAKEYLAENFAKKDTFLFICATGITVRLIAPLIKTKDQDPAVVVMDEMARYVIPLLSGHLGGANRAALQLAELLNAEPVVTTATDINGRFAVDVWTKDAGCVIKDVSGIKKVSSAVLEGKKIGIQSSFPFKGGLPAELTEGAAEIGICVSLWGKEQPFTETFHVIPKIVTLGTGCRRGVSSLTFENFILRQLAQNHVDIVAVEQICSIDLKKSERCILDFSEKYGIPFVTYTAEQLEQTEGDFSPSHLVKRVTGVDNVCERSAVRGSGMGKKILSKTSGEGITCALAIRDWKCEF